MLEAHQQSGRPACAIASVGTQPSKFRLEMACGQTLFGWESPHTNQYLRLASKSRLCRIACLSYPPPFDETVRKFRVFISAPPSLTHRVNAGNLPTRSVSEGSGSRSNYRTISPPFDIRVSAGGWGSACGGLRFAPCVLTPFASNREHDPANRHSWQRRHGNGL
jgi:hypothetical protein